MNIVVKPGKADEDVKTTFVKLVVGTAAGFIATALVESAIGKALSSRKNKTNTTQS